MTNKMRLRLILGSIGVAGALLTSVPDVAADPPWCVYPVTLYCQGRLIAQPWVLSGNAGCDGGQNCRCPLSAHDWALVSNQCAGQAP